MKILVTGANGFIGKNLIAELRNRNYDQIFKCGRDTDAATFSAYCQEADFVFHLAGVNRPKDESEFMDGNYGLISTLVSTLSQHNNACPIVFASSIQANMDNPYGISKRAGEEVLIKYSRESGAKAYIYQLPNVFGKWCKPNYNSVIATFCNNVANDIPIQINDPSVVMKLVYIDDVIEEFISKLNLNEIVADDYFNIPVQYTSTLEDIVQLLKSYKNSREERTIPDTLDAFKKKLYSTYLSYLPQEKFSYELKMNTDQRGSFTEFIRTPDRGQVSINISKPGIVKGNHWHHTKNEKFLVVSGQGVIRFRKIDSDQVIEYFVSGDKLEVVDIPVGYTHNIENLGDTDMVTVMWVNEMFDQERPDTYFLEV